MNTTSKKTRTQKLLVSFFLCAILIFSFGVNVFAALPTDYGNSSFESPIGNSMWLNTWTAGQVAEGDYIRLYALTNDNSQRWRAYNASSGYYSMRCVANTSLAINRAYPSANAILYTYTKPGAPLDSDMSIPIVGSTWQFHLVRTGESLNATGPKQGDYVNFSSSQWNIDWRRVG